jgi:predicted RNA binding protein YcfA (HicA-like mRNA interferase family)
MPLAAREIIKKTEATGCSFLRQKGNDMHISTRTAESTLEGAH